MQSSVDPGALFPHAPSFPLLSSFLPSSGSSNDRLYFGSYSIKQKQIAKRRKIFKKMKYWTNAQSNIIILIRNLYTTTLGQKLKLFSERVTVLLLAYKIVMSNAIRYRNKEHSVGSLASLFRKKHMTSSKHHLYRETERKEQITIVLYCIGVQARTSGHFVQSNLFPHVVDNY